MHFRIQVSSACTLETLRLRFFSISREHQEFTWPGPCHQVCCLRFTFVRLDHTPEVSDLLQGFLNPKTSQSHIWDYRILLLIDYQWPLCVIASDEQISQPSLVWKQNSSHLHSLCVGILFNCTALGIHLCKTSQLYILKTRLGGEIYSSDVNMHKGYFYFKKT